MRVFIIATSLVLAIVTSTTFAQDPPKRSVEIEKMNV